MFQSKSIFFILLLAISQLAAAGFIHLNRKHNDILEHRTNAARMADGLPPLPPRELKARHYPSSPTQPNKPQPSQPGKPDCDDKQKVRIKCTRTTGGDVGYISSTFSKRGKQGYGLCSDSKDALQVDFENSVTPFDFKISGADSSPYPCLGFSGNNIRPGTSDSAILTSTRKTNKNAGPSNVGNSFSSWSANSESQVWYYSRDTKAIQATWINSGGDTAASAMMFYNLDDDVFHLVTDSKQFVTEYPNAYQVQFSLDE